MNCLLFYNGKQNAIGIWEAMEKAKWNVVWTRHTTDSVNPTEGYEQALIDWKKTCAGG